MQYKMVHVSINKTYFACRVRAMTPDMRGVEALVPVKLSVHCPFRVAVVYCEIIVTKIHFWESGSKLTSWS